MSLKIFKEKIHRKIGKKSSKLFLNIDLENFKIMSLRVDDSVPSRARKISKRARNKIHRQRVEIPLCEDCNQKPAIYYKEYEDIKQSEDIYFYDCGFKFPKLDGTKFKVGLSNIKEDTELYISHLCNNCSMHP